MTDTDWSVESITAPKRVQFNPDDADSTMSVPQAERFIQHIFRKYRDKPVFWDAMLYAFKSDLGTKQVRSGGHRGRSNG
jgi:hypothetical protein